LHLKNKSKEVATDNRKEKSKNISKSTEFIQEKKNKKIK